MPTDLLVLAAAMLAAVTATTAAAEGWWWSLFWQWPVAALLVAALQRFGRHRPEQPWWLFLCLLVHGWWCLGLGLSAAVPTTVSVLPFASLLWLGWTMRDRYAARDRARLLLMPILLLLSIHDVGLWLGGLLVDATGGFGGEIVAVATTVVALLFGPLLLVRLWPTQPAEQILAEPVHILARRWGVRLGQVRLWGSERDGGPGLVNAAVLGFVAPWRYLLIGRGLLAGLGPQELIAVLGHELGHLRHRHLLTLLLGGLVTMSAATLVAHSVAPIDDDLLGHVLVLLPALLVAGLVILGPLSRALERQADLAGAELAGDPQHLQRALLRVAELTGTDPRAPSWRHGSIASRVAWLDAVRLDPGLAARHHGRVRQFRFVLFALLALLALLTFMGSRSTPPTLAELRSEDRRLALAVDRAAAGEPSELERWLAARESQQRARYALALFVATGSDAYDRQLAPHLHLLRPLARIPIGHATIDGEVDNLVAYALVASSSAPLPSDIDLAGRIADRMEGPTIAGRRHDWANTIGSVRSRQQRHGEAVAWFERSLHWSDERPGLLQRWLGMGNPTVTRDLYSARRDAASASAALPLAWELLPMVAGTTAAVER